MAEQRSFSAGFRCPPRAPSLHDPSRASHSMSSPTTPSPSSKTVAKGLRPSALGIASPRSVTKGHPQGTSSPVTSSTLRAISGSGSDRTHGLRPDAPVSPRALLGDPRGPPAHFGCLQPVWASMEPTLRARGATPQPLLLHSTRLRPHPRGSPLPPPLCPHRRHRPPACRSLPPPLGLLSLRAAPGSPHQLPAMTATWNSACPN